MVAPLIYSNLQLREANSNVAGRTIQGIRRGEASCQFTQCDPVVRLSNSFLSSIELPQERTNFVRPPCLAEQEALTFRAALKAKLFKLVDGLDAFRTRGHPERAAQSRNGTNNGSRLRLFEQIPYERLVDLDLVERKFLQISEAGIAGTEVVHRNAYADIFQLIEDQQRRLCFLEQDGLRDLEFEATCR